MSTAARPRRGWPLASAVSAAVLSASALMLAIGWLEIPALVRMLSTSRTMIVLTAIGFALSALALWLESRGAPLCEDGSDPSRSQRARLARLCAVLVITIGMLGLATRLPGWNPLLDDLPLAAATPSRMSACTALAFIFLGTAFLSARHASLGKVHHACVMLTLLLAWLGSTQHLYGSPPLPFAAMELHSAVLLLMLAAGALTLRRGVGVFALFGSEGASGAGIRRLLPAALLVPVAAGALALYARGGGSLETRAAVSLIAFLSTTGFVALLWTHAARMERRDTQLERQQRAHAADGERTSAALREYQHLLQAIVDNSTAVIYVKDLAGRYILLNRRFEEIFELDRETTLGRSDREIFPAQVAAAFRAMDERVVAANRALTEEETAHHHDGQRTYVSVKAPLHDASGSTYAVFGISTDITERKRAEEALRESEGRLRILAESLPQLVWTCQPDGGCDYLSPQWIEYTGHPAAEQLGRGYIEALHAEDRERVGSHWAEATARGEPFDIEFRIRRADGEYRWFRTRVIPLRDAAGRISKWFASSTDFEGAKRSEERLRAQLERLNLLDTTTRAIGERQDLRSIFRIVLRSLEERLPVDFGCVCMHDGAERTLSVVCVGEHGRRHAPDMELCEEARIDIDRSGLAPCISGPLVYEADVADSPLPFPARFARSGLRSVVFAPLLVENEVLGVMIAARSDADAFTSGECEFLRQLSQHVALAAHQAQLYTALHRAYEDLRQSQQTILQQERLRALGQMASGIAHDINNALSPAALYVQSLLERDTSLSDRARGCLEIIQRAIEDVAHTVARMREFYRPRETELTATCVDLNQTLQQVLELTRARWSDMPQERGSVIEVQTELEEALPPVPGALSEIRDALTNLILNAVDAMPDGGTLTLRSRSCTRTAAGSHACIEVSDSGVGMSESVRTRCLEPFFTTKGERGTGLGLAMVYGMVQRHRGQLEIDSEPQRGTTIRLIFPGGATDAAPQPAAMQPLPRLRILAIDDDPLILESLQATLEHDGHEVTVAHGGQAGIDAFALAQRQSERFSVVITDLGMPNVDGRTVAMTIKTAAPATPVIMLTGWGHRLHTDAELPAHVDRVLGKPPKLSDVRAALRELAGDRPEPAAGSARSS